MVLREEKEARGMGPREATKDSFRDSNHNTIIIYCNTITTTTATTTILRLLLRLLLPRLYYDYNYDYYTVVSHSPT